MKKSRLMLFVAPALLLVSCGVDGQIDSLGVTLPTGGTDTTLDVAAPKLAKALGGTAAAGAFSASLSIPSAISTITTPDVTIEETLTNGAASLAVEGYTGTTAAGLKAAASLGFDSLKFKITTPEKADSQNDNPFANADIEVGKIGLNAYVANSNFYLDISDQTFRNALISALASGDSTMASAYSSMLPSKLFVAGILADKDLPLFDVTSIGTQLDGIGAQIAEKASLFNKFFTMKDYSDGTTAVYAKFDKDSIADFIATGQGIEPDEGYNYSSALSDLRSGLGDNKIDFSFALTFNEDHLLSVAVGEDLDISVTEHDEYEGDMTTHVVSEAAMKLTFAYGDDVNVNLPANFDDYLAFNVGD